MKPIVALLLIAISVLHAQESKIEGHLIPAFSLDKSDLELTRVAQPSQYFDKVGTRSALIGYESGSFEAWVWPWKPMRNFELSFMLGTSTQPIPASEIVRTISVTPAATVLTFTHESFTVREIVFVPRNEPGAVILLDVHTTVPFTIVAGFIPVMQPMWPAGIGGQFSYWDDDVNGYVISEGQWRAMFICGSPAGKQMAAPPAHMFADNPLQFRVEVAPDETNGKYIPVVIAGAVPDPVTKRMTMDSVKATYTRLWRDAEKYYREDCSYYDRLRASTIRISTPYARLNLAFEWGKIALDNLLVTNANLGTGLVAGYGLSGGGERPGFAWFFGGDAFINSMAIDSYQDFSKVRQALAFTQQWQRQENFPVRKKNPSDPPRDVGKMAHELSQSDGLCDWWNDYHYGYNHADTTPWYIVSMADYVRASGDTSFLRKNWNSVRLAYAWCLSKDSDGDGLMDLKGAGLGALEFGKLVGIYADIYTCGVWVQAVREMNYMAKLLGDEETASKAEAQYERARPVLEKKFWLDKEKFYSYGATEKGEQVHEKTPWSGVAMMFGLLDNERTAKSLEALDEADICTDWGVRSLSNRSDLFDPTNYNYGAVWPFISSFFNTAQFRYRSTPSAFGVLQSNIDHAFDHALGVVPEVFSGAMNEKLAEGYHHQGFSTTGYMLPMMRGLLGVEVDAVTRTVSVRPSLPPDWDSVTIRNISVGGFRYDISITQNDTLVRLSVCGGDTGSFAIEFSPVLPPARIIDRVLMNGREVKSGTTSGETAGGTLATEGGLPVRVQAAKSDNIDIRYHPAVALLYPYLHPEPGAANKGLKIISEKFVGNPGPLLKVIAEGMAGSSYTVGLLAREHVASVSGGALEAGGIKVGFDGKPGSGFVQKEIEIKLK